MPDSVKKRYIRAKQAGVFPGTVNLSDSVNWDVDKALIKTIIVETIITDCILFILQNDNGLSTDDANISTFEVIASGNGNELIHLDHPYEDEDGTQEFHVVWQINVQQFSTVDITVIGIELV